MDSKILYKYFEGKATLEEELMIRDWLDKSPDNMAILLEERKIFDSMLISPTCVESDYLVDEIRSKSRIKIIFKEFLKIAAIITIAILGTTYWISNKEDNNIAMQTIKVPAGQRLNIILPDGTAVWLNAQTTIKYPVSFNRKERLVEIDGQAYFDVAPNKDVPFIVSTEEGRVQALGTKFDVLAYSADNTFETMLLEGSVKIDLKNNPKQSVILKPNDKAYYQNDMLVTENVQDKSEYEWRNGLLSFRNKKFEDIMKTFEKTYDIKIVIDNPNIENKEMTAKFRIVDGIDYALRVLQRDIDFRFAHDKEDRDIEIIYITQQ